jgi:hypothetical protein
MRVTNAVLLNEGGGDEVAGASARRHSRAGNRHTHALRLPGMTRRLFTAMSLVGLVLIMPAIPSAAAVAPQLSVSPQTGSPGTQVTVIGTGFCPTPCSTVEIDISGRPVLRDVSVGGSGSFRATVSVPANTVAGSSTVYAVQQDSQGNLRQASTRFTITPGGAPSGASNPHYSPSSATPNKTTSSAPSPTGSPTSATPLSPRPSTPDSSRSAFASTAASDSVSAAAGSSAGHGRGAPGWAWALVAIVIGAAGLGVLLWWRRRRA